MRIILWGQSVRGSVRGAEASQLQRNDLLSGLVNPPVRSSFGGKECRGKTLGGGAWKWHIFQEGKTFRAG